MKKAMQFFLLGYFAVAIQVDFAYGQYRQGFLRSSSSLEECRGFFEKNVHLLHPIEGVYNVTYKQTGINRYQTFPAEISRKTLSIYETVDDRYSIVGSPNMRIARIGETNSYNLIISWPDIKYEDTQRFTLSDNSFNVSFEIPQKQMQKDMGRNYQPGFRVRFELEAIKEYPTPAMYNQSDRRTVNSFQTVSGTSHRIKYEIFVTMTYNMKTEKTSEAVQNFIHAYTENNKLFLDSRVYNLHNETSHSNGLTDRVQYDAIDNKMQRCTVTFETITGQPPMLKNRIYIIYENSDIMYIYSHNDPE